MNKKASLFLQILSFLVFALSSTTFAKNTVYFLTMGSFEDLQKNLKELDHKQRERQIQNLINLGVLFEATNYLASNSPETHEHSSSLLNALDLSPPRRVLPQEQHIRLVMAPINTNSRDQFMLLTLDRVDIATTVIRFSHNEESRSNLRNLNGFIQNNDIQYSNLINTNMIKDGADESFISSRNIEPLELIYYTYTQRHFSLEQNILPMAQANSFQESVMAMDIDNPVAYFNNPTAQF
ncbi:MAG: hypothetical protein KKE11_03725 [Gammaproteobacteria bacterium]|nr:hypothetical protein [Gammaproteobacteria bacterium]